MSSSAVLHPSEALWGGRLGAVAAPHAALGLLRGFYRYQPQRGLCEVRGVGPNLWLAAAQGLGFRVEAVRFQDRAFLRILALLARPPRSVRWGCYRKRHRNLTVVFTDVASLPDVPSNSQYWRAWNVTHVFFADPSTSPVAPPGWETRSRTHDHWMLGGSTTSRWKLIAWYPTGLVPCEPVTVPKQPWIPLHARIDEMVPSAPHPPPPGLRRT